MSAPYSFKSVRANPESAVSIIHVELTMKSDIAALLERTQINKFTSAAVVSQARSCPLSSGTRDQALIPRKLCLQRS